MLHTHFERRSVTDGSARAWSVERRNAGATRRRARLVAPTIMTGDPMDVSSSAATTLDLLPAA